MKTDQDTLNFAAAVLCCVGSVAAVAAAMADRGTGPRSAIISGLLGTVGSAAWAAAAYQDVKNKGPELT